MSIKKCEHCGKEFETKFPNHQLYCSRSCRYAAFYFKHKEAKQQYKIQHTLKNPSLYLYRAVKSRANSQNIPFNLEESDIVIPSVCPVLGISIKIHTGRGGYFPDSPTVDRIIPELGYVKGNVKIISFRANLLKTNATLTELKAIVKYIEDNNNND